jgi:formylglycine-generating enzyme required for sulfatase activity
VYNNHAIMGGQGKAGSLWRRVKRALITALTDDDPPTATDTRTSAHHDGDGAVAQGTDARAVGARGVNLEGGNYGVINTGTIIQTGTQPGASTIELRRAYLARILTQAEQLPLFAADGGKDQVKLSSIYTALSTQRSQDEAITRGIAESAARRRVTERLSALDVLNSERKLVILGGPGSGKSTFVNFVALCMAGELLGASPNLAMLRAPLPREEEDREDPRLQRWDHDALEPVRIILRDLASQLPPAGAKGNAAIVWAYIKRLLRQASLERYADHLKDHLLSRGGLILFDGLDEVPDQSRRVQIKKAVQDFAASFSKCRFLVTSRTYAYQRQDWKLDGFAETQLLPFTPGQVAGFVDAWYAHMIQLERLPPATARDRGEVLKRAARYNRHIGELAERPLLLTLIAKVQSEKGGVLPEKREELYDKALEMLLNEWEHMKVRVGADGAKEYEPSLGEWLKASRDDIRKQLNRLAFDAHSGQSELVGSADIPQEKVIAALLEASADREDVKVKRLEEYLRDRAGILTEHGVKLYQFPHRSFQEYLAACHLTDDDFPGKLAGLARNDPNRWREVVLLAGAKAARGSALTTWALSEALCSALPPEGSATVADYWGSLLAGGALVESADHSRAADYNKPKLERVRLWQVAIMRHNTLPAVERALAGRTLAALGDPRLEVMSLDGMQFCLVLPGPFQMGDDRSEYDDEKLQHTVNLAYPYFIARFPVSVAQWREYLKRSGATLDDEDSTRGRGNDPVASVDWHDAQRFCAFLTLEWRNQLPPGFVVQLPSEAEWEKAARGGQHIPRDFECVSLAQLVHNVTVGASVPATANTFPERSYPWGDSFDFDRSNTEANVGETSALGCYPSGCSPYGCEEMSGNVWEWTRSLWGKEVSKPDFAYPYDPNDSRREDPTADDDVYRVVRGGSWISGRGGARCAYRYGDLPDGRGGSLGFRVVVRFAPVA